MDYISPLWGILKDLWGCASIPLGYIYNLKENVGSLQKATDDLKAKSNDVTKKVKLEEQGGGAQRTNEVANWLGKVQEFEGRVEQVREEVEERDQIKCLIRCLPQNCRSSYKLGKRVDQLLNEARELQHQEREFRHVTSPLLPPPQDLEMPTGKTVGLDNALDEVWKWLIDEKEAGVIGLYGTGGVGKTTLMKRINEKLLRANHGFKVVIWVVMSRQVNEDRIRDAIRKRLNIEDKNWERWSRDERVRHLFEDLKQKKFVLLIDDVWGRLDLSKIGVPSPDLENGSKVVLTTRSKQVCHQMQANRTLEVTCLKPEEALALFENNIGKSTVDSNPEIPELAKEIVQECEGLPLAIITIGRAMAGIENPREWKHALETLRKNPYKFSGMVEEVYHILELSYDKLDDSCLQSCFLYCCLFPEDYYIKPHDLIGLWIGERLLGNTNDVYNLRNEGEHVLGRLNRACLLETWNDDDEDNDENGEYVKMHDVIRDMAIWIARDRGKKENKFLVIENEEDISEETISKWRDAKKVSLWGQRIENIDRTPPKHSQVETLFVRETQVVSLPRGFLESMKAHLMVLDLSDNEKMTSFLEEICELNNLRYLNLSRTGIRELPRKIEKLTRLRWLLLDEIDGPLLIPTGAIASIPLIVFSFWDALIAITNTNCFGVGSCQEKEEEMVEELGHMQHLTDLSIRVFESSSALKILQSPYLRRRIRRAEIRKCEGLTRIEISGDSPGGGGGFSHLEELRLVRCKALRKMEIGRGGGRAPIRSCFPSLVVVKVFRCQHLEDLSCLVHAPNLQILWVGGCDSMERMIGDGFTGEELAAWGLFSRLQTLNILGCESMERIIGDGITGEELAASGLFSRLQTLKILGCESMERIIGDGFTGEELATSGLFSRLQTLHLSDLPKLRSICDQTLSFPQGVAFRIEECPGLRQLPLDSDSVNGRSFQVIADEEWWERFEWDPIARVTLKLDESLVGEMTFEEAVRKLKDMGIPDKEVMMEFGP